MDTLTSSFRALTPLGLVPVLDTNVKEANLTH